MISKLRALLGLNPPPNYKQLLIEGAIIVDVRSQGEFASGHIKGSKNLPLQTLQTNNQLSKYKDKPIIVCCASGMRSASARSILKSKGFAQVYNGGGWNSLNHKI